MIDEKKVEEAIFILRRTIARFERPVILWAGGKDSTTLLDLARKSIPKGAIFPFGVALLDTGYQFAETYNFMERVSRAWKIKYVKIRSPKFVEVNPWDYRKIECCEHLKIGALETLLRKDVDAIIEGIRWDEHHARGKNIGEDAELFDIGEYHKEEPIPHARIYPIQNFTYQDVWDYIRDRNLPVNPLYESQDYRKNYKSIGCWPCTEPVEKDADERSGRSQDKEKIMERLRHLGYM